MLITFPLLWQVAIDNDRLIVAWSCTSYSPWYIGLWSILACGDHVENAEHTAEQNHLPNDQGAKEETTAVQHIPVT